MGVFEDRASESKRELRIIKAKLRDFRGIAQNQGLNQTQALALVRLAERLFAESCDPETAFSRAKAGGKE